MRSPPRIPLCCSQLHQHPNNNLPPVFGETKVFELCPGGKDKPLTAANRDEYVQLYTEYVLHKSIETQFAAFK